MAGILQGVLASIGSSAGPYIEDVFSTYLYTSSPQSLSVANGIPLGNASSSQFSLAGYTVTNLGAAFNNSFPMRNLTDGVVEIANAQNIAYVGGSFFDVYVDLVNPAVVTAYNISPQGVRGVQVYNTPQAFIVKASNNASTWTTIATFTDISTSYPDWNAGTFRVFSFANTTAYRYWRIENTVAGVAMSEWNLTGTTTAEVKGGLVWMKARNTAGFIHALFDTTRGVQKTLCSNTTDAQATETGGLTAFSPNGFSLGSWSPVNSSTAYNYCSWTFAEQAKFFDVVTYTGTGTTMTVPHNLGSVPGMMIVKGTDAASAWDVYHRSLGNTQILRLSTDAAASTQPQWNDTSPTSTVFTVKGGETTNVSGRTYVAYLFAHDAGGFGTSGTDNVISCGSFTNNGSGAATISLGYEPQYVLIKNTQAAENWTLADNMRGMPNGSADAILEPNTSSAEASYDYITPTATGFNIQGLNASQTYIYMAIRRPMKVPTVGTSVFSPNAFEAALGTKIFTGFPVDLQWIYGRPGGTPNSMDRLRGVSTTSTARGIQLQQSNTNAETAAAGNGSLSWDSTGFQVSNDWRDYSDIAWNFSRRPGFFDEVCYTGTGTQTAFNHNLTVAPELLIVKRRDAVSTQGWATGTNFTSTSFLNLLLNTTDAGTTNNYADVTLWKAAPTSTTFTVGSFAGVNASGGTYVAYLFATCLGVSKVGSYTGTGATLNISCGFTGGARFVLIKRTDSTGNWWAWDTARGMISGTDPRSTINSTAAELNNDWVFTITGGFSIVTTDASVNASGGSYIFLAIA